MSIPSETPPLELRSCDDHRPPGEAAAAAAAQPNLDERTLHQVFVATLRGEAFVTTWVAGAALMPLTGPLADVLPELGRPPRNAYLVWEGTMGREPVGAWRVPMSSELVAWFAGNLSRHWGTQ